MINNQKLDVYHAIAVKFWDVDNKMVGAIKVGGLVIVIANHLGFDMDNMPYDKIKGRALIDIYMMIAIGMVTWDNSGQPHVIHGHPPAQDEAEEEQAQPEDLNMVI